MLSRRTALFACLTIGIAALSAAAGLGSPIASAAPGQNVDYGGQCVIAMSPPNPQPGQSATLTGDHFPPNSSQPIMFQSTPQQIGTANIGADGTFSTTITIPADAAPGEHTISVACASTGVAASATINVGGVSTTQTTASSGGGGNGGGGGNNGGSFANTGNDSEPKVVIGFAAIAVGVALVAAARRRRRRHIAPT